MNYLHSLIIAVLGIAAIGVVGLAQEADAQVTGDIHGASVSITADSFTVDFPDVANADVYRCIIWTGNNSRDNRTVTSPTDSMCEFDNLTANTEYSFNIRAKPGGYIYQSAQTLTTLASDGTNSNLLDVMSTTPQDVHGGQTTIGADFIEVDIPDAGDRYRCVIWQGDEDRSAFTSRDSECRFSGLTPDTEYRYNIRVYNEGDRFNYYTPARTVTTTPSASDNTDPNTYPDSSTTESMLPTTLGTGSMATITRSTDTITIDFDDVDNARFYKCFITDDTGREQIKVRTSLCVFEGLESGTDYDINIRYKATGNSGHVFDGAQTITTP